MGKAALIFIIGVTLVIGKMLIGLNERTLAQTEMITTHYESNSSRNIANSAATMAVSELSRDYNWREGMTETSMAGGSFNVSVQDINFDTSLTMQRVKVTTISTYDGRKDTVTVVVAKAPFSHYAQFTDLWPSTNSYATGDTIYGPVHTNTKFKFWGNPVFFGKVSQVDTSYLTQQPANPQFLGGLQLGADPIPMPDFSSGLQALVDSANAGGDVYTGEVWLNFNANGSYDYFLGANFVGAYDGTKNLSSHNGIIMTDGSYNIHVQGTFNGQGTIYSGKHIYIEDDIVYADDPRTNPSSQDMLGLVATRHVTVAYTVANQTDVEIHGAIMALDSKFMVEDLNGTGLMGTLTTFGSTIQKNRGTRATGYVDGSGNVVLTNGYYLKALYDARFLQAGPPVYPTTEKALIYSWQEDTKYTVGYGVSQGLAGGEGIGGSNTEAGEVESEPLANAVAELQRIRDDFQDMVDNYPGTETEDEAGKSVNEWDNALQELYKETPTFADAITDIGLGRSHIDHLINHNEGIIATPALIQYKTDLDALVVSLSLLGP